jgi:hypothetical protein
MGEPSGQRYSDHQSDSGDIVAAPAWWSGICRVTEPDDLALDDANEALIAARHDVSDDGREITASLMNDMWAVMELLTNRYLDLSVAMMSRSGTGTIPTDTYPGLRDAYDAGKALADADIETESFEYPISTDAMAGVFTTLLNGYDGTWDGQVHVEEAAIEISGGWSDGGPWCEELVIRLLVNDYTVTDLFGGDLHNPEFSLGVPGGSSVALQSKLIDTVPASMRWRPIEVTVDPLYYEAATFLVPIDYLGPDPRPPNTPAPGPGIIGCWGNCALKIGAVSLADGSVYARLSKNFPPEVFETIRHRTFTEIEIDDHKFLDTGFIDL